jgi:hypothetical protein
MSAAGELSATELDPPARNRGEYRSVRTLDPGGGLYWAKDAVARRQKKTAKAAALVLMEASR